MFRPVASRLTSRHGPWRPRLRRVGQGGLARHPGETATPGQCPSAPHPARGRGPRAPLSLRPQPGRVKKTHPALVILRFQSGLSNASLALPQARDLARSSAASNCQALTTELRAWCKESAEATASSKQSSRAIWAGASAPPCPCTLHAAIRFSRIFFALSHGTGQPFFQPWHTSF